MLPIKNLLKTLFIFLIFSAINGILLIQPSPAATGDFDNFVYANCESDVIFSYKKTEAAEWNKYFKSYAKKLKKNFKKNKQIFKDKKYRTSYARIIFIVNKKGELLSYKIKSSCTPANDKEFLNIIKKTIDITSSPAPLPANFENDFIVFTIKFHTNLPNHLNTKNIDWQRYGIADIEMDNHNIEVFLK